MSAFDGLRHRLHVALRGEGYARETQRELQFHADLETLGRTQRERETAPRRALGNVTYYREEVRGMTTLHLLDRLRQDAGYALRGLRRSPGFTIGAALTLGLGIGVNGAVFSLIDRIFLQPPEGVERPTEVRRIYRDFRSDGTPGRLVRPQMAYPQLRALRASLDSSVALGAYSPPDSIDVRDGNARIPAIRSLINTEYFGVLGIRPAAGRFFGPSEADVAVPAPVAVISDAFWHRAFDGRRDVIGKHVRVGSFELSVVGIAPPGFTGVDLDAIDLWTPASLYEGGGGGGGQWYDTFGARFEVLTRVNGASLEERVLTLGTNAVRPIEMKGLEYDSTVVLRAGPLIEARGPGERPAEVTIATRVAGVALMVLIIACANVTNLFLLRAARRRREIGIRQALGVTRLRLAQQFVVESVLLAALGGAVAILFSVWSAAALRRLVLPQVHWSTRPVDLRAAMFIALVAIVAGLIAGLIPFVQPASRELATSLRPASVRVSFGGSRFRSSLVVVQTALCLMLLIGAGLFIRSLTGVQAIGVGYDPRDVISVRPTFDDAASRATDLRAPLSEAATRLRAMPGVEAVAYTSVPPLQGAMYRSIYLPGRDSLPQLPEDYGPSIVSVSPDFFKASGLPIRQGREFVASDQKSSQPVAMIGESLAKLYWPGESAIGKCIVFPKRDGPCHIIVGIAGDAHRRRIIEPTIGQVYFPLTQSPDAPHDLIVRVHPGRTASVIHDAEAVLRSTVPGMAGMRARTLASVLEPELRPWRLGVTLFSTLGILALVVAVVGLYSVVAYGVSQRLHEMGIRIALGARLGDVVRLVLGDGLKAVGVGIALGTLGALALGRLVASLLYGIAPNDARVLLSAIGVLGAIAALACLVPALRAGRVDPVTSLRAE
jgi:putative ABC transport system permease protein